MEYIIPIVAGVVCLILGFLIGFFYRKKKAEKQIGAAETEATRIINEAIKSAEAKKKESILEAREEIYKSRTENEKELKERRAEVQKQEHRINQREEALDKKYESVEAKEEKLTQRLKEVDEQEQKLRELEKAEREILERISTMTVEEAKSYLIKQVEEEARHDAAIKLKEIERELKDECDERAREVLSIAIQRCAADHASEITVSTVSLPNDDMKGRIIGREGRNIRAIENLTGVDLIIDDTPEAITLSSFDPVRREVARLTLEKLIADGRIHPARIEETVAKSQKEVDAVIRQEGERAIFETGVAGVHPELIKLLGRMRYRTSYGQNVLKHSIEVSHISGLLASELGSDITLAKRAGLLHDIGKAVTHEVDGSHVNLGVELCEKYHEKADVIHAIHAHHGDIDAESVTDFIVQAADAISAARPGARRENLEAYIKRLEKLEELAHSMKGVDKCFAFQAGREIRILVKPEEVKDDDMVILAHDLARKIESEMNYPGQVKVHVVRETRAVEFAK